MLECKALNGNACKQRLRLWDGDTELTQAVLDLSSSPQLAVLTQYSVVSLQGVRVKQAGEKWAFIIAGYSVVKDGATVGSKLGQPAR